MGITAVVGLIGAAATVYSAETAQSSAKKQAAQVAENARQAAAQAAEESRGNALAAQTAAERQQAQDTAAANAKLSLTESSAKPDVQISPTSDPTEAVRRRVVRASFTPDQQAGAAGAIRV